MIRDRTRSEEAARALRRRAVRSVRFAVLVGVLLAVHFAFPEYEDSPVLRIVAVLAAVLAAFAFGLSLPRRRTARDDLIVAQDAEEDTALVLLMIVSAVLWFVLLVEVLRTRNLAIIALLVGASLVAVLVARYVSKPAPRNPHRTRRALLDPDPDPDRDPDRE